MTLQILILLFKTFYIHLHIETNLVVETASCWVQLLLNWRSNPSEKGVIEILSSNSKLGGLISSEDNLTMTPASLAIPMPEMGRLYMLNRCGAVVLSTAKVRQDLELR